MFLVIITTSILMPNNTRNLPLRKGFPNPNIAFYLKQMDKLNWKSELNLKLFGSILFQSWSWSFSAPIFFSELELELLGSIFCSSELELDPQSSGGQIGAGSKLEPIVHLWKKWHVTCGTWHGTCDIWHVTRLWFMILWRSEGKGWIA